MAGEHSSKPALTADQEATANDLIELCGLEPYADATVEMMGETGTVRYGLGRCAHHLMELTPVEIADMVMLKLGQHAQPGAEAR